MTDNGSTAIINQDKCLTRRQHFVPRVYQRGWTAARWALNPPATQSTLWVHDLQCGKAFPAGPNGILAENWFYEQDPDIPDNELERFFQDDEAAYGNTMRFFDFVFSNALEIIEGNHESAESYLQRTFASCISALPKHILVLKRFAAMCYVRVPAALKIKRGELAAHPESAEIAKQISSAYHLVSMARDSTLSQRFDGLSAQLWLTIDSEFVSSDRPCFDVDVSGSGYHPLLGYDIGRRNDVMAVFPLSSRMMLTLAPRELHVLGQRTSPRPLSVRVLDADSVKLVNAATVNMAARWVIAQNQNTAIFNERISVR